MIIARWQVENQSGLNLRVHFDQQSIIIPRKQSASILLRYAIICFLVYDIMKYQTVLVLMLVSFPDLFNCYVYV